jgi:hypothetical protein
LAQQTEELTIRLSKYEKRVSELEEQSLKHNDLHERMKSRIKQMTIEMEEKNENVIVLLFYVNNSLIVCLFSFN